MGRLLLSAARFVAAARAPFPPRPLLTALLTLPPQLTAALPGVVPGFALSKERLKFDGSAYKVRRAAARPPPRFARANFC